MKRERKHSLLLVGLAYLSFVSLGLPDGLNGVAWPSIRVYFDLPLDALGALLVMFTMLMLLAFYVGLTATVARRSEGAPPIV